MDAFTLLLGGELTRTPRLDAQTAGSRVIAADAGILHAAPLGLAPELWVGDFDSVPAELRDAFPEVERRVFPADKDQTDGEIAIDAALALGARSLVLAGAFGGPRADHAFLHLTAAMRLAEAGLDVLLTSGLQEGVPLRPGRAAFDYADGTPFSIIAFTALSGLSLAGARWPLAAIDLPFGSSLTISNAVSGRLTAALGHGRAMLIAHLFAEPKAADGPTDPAS
jgi:thiamine pyrophosphokinase